VSAEVLRLLVDDEAMLLLLLLSWLGRARSTSGALRARLLDA